MSETHKYIVCIGTEGFEALFEITDHMSQDSTFAALQGKPYGDDALMYFLHSMSLRIRFNGHRNIMSYIVNLSADRQEFSELLKTDTMLNFVKEKGEPLDI